MGSFKGEKKRKKYMKYVICFLKLRKFFGIWGQSDNKQTHRGNVWEVKGCSVSFRLGLDTADPPSLWHRRMLSPSQSNMCSPSPQQKPETLARRWLQKVDWFWVETWYRNLESFACFLLVNYNQMASTVRPVCHIAVLNSTTRWRQRLEIG